MRRLLCHRMPALNNISRLPWIKGNQRKFELGNPPGPSFSPADLFANDEEGVWFDPSDLSTMFQDSTGTIPVTADGQPVNLILDKSGNNHHALAPNATARPLYKTDGTYHWLQFDGVDDYIGCTWPSITALSTLFAGVNRTSSNSWVMFMPFTSSSKPFLGVCQAGAETPTDSGSGTPSYTVNNTLVSPSQRDVLHSAIGVNSKKVVTIENIDFDDPVSPWSGFGFGLYGGFYPTFNMYSTIAVGKQCTPTEITDTETWVNGKTGAY